MSVIDALLPAAMRNPKAAVPQKIVYGPNGVKERVETEGDMTRTVHYDSKGREIFKEEARPHSTYTMITDPDKNWGSAGSSIRFPNPVLLDRPMTLGQLAAEHKRQVQAEKDGTAQLDVKA